LVIFSPAKKGVTERVGALHTATSFLYNGDECSRGKQSFEQQ
jgi:hypothetical protein